MRSVASILATFFSRAEWFKAGFGMASPVGFEYILAFQSQFVTGLSLAWVLGLVGFLPLSAQPKGDLLILKSLLRKALLEYLSDHHGDCYSVFVQYVGTL